MCVPPAAQAEREQDEREQWVELERHLPSSSPNCIKENDILAPSGMHLAITVWHHISELTCKMKHLFNFKQ